MDPLSGVLLPTADVFHETFRGVAEGTTEAIRQIRKQDTDQHRTRPSIRPRRDSAKSGILKRWSTTSIPHSTNSGVISETAERESLRSTSDRTGPLSPDADLPSAAEETPYQDPPDSIPSDKPSRSLLRSVGEPAGKFAVGTGVGIVRIAGAGFKSPATITYGLARGFHNAPKLYGDKTVRQTEKITGVRSGMSAAGKVSHVPR
jgi:hypothetical protein